jgi:hypothetical protein
LIENREKAFVTNEFQNYNKRVGLHVSKLVKVVGNREKQDVSFSKIMDNFVFQV